MENQNYETTITKSSFEMTARQKVKFKDLSTAESINTILKKADDKGLTLQNIAGWYTVHVVNPQSTRNKEYDVFVILANGSRYQTGSQYVMQSFLDIANELGEEIFEDDISISILKLPSKTNPDNGFYKCVLN